MMTTPPGDGTATGQSQSGTDSGDQTGQQGNTGQQGTNQGTGDGDGAGDGDQGQSGGRTPEQEAAHWKAMARKHEQRAKENSKAAQRLQELEDKDKTELQRANERAQRAEAAQAEAVAARQRMIAAATHGLTTDLVDFLGTGTEDEINARAETLKAQVNAAAQSIVEAELAKYGLRPGQAGTAPTAGAAASLALGRRPAQQLRPGSAPANGNTPQDANAAFRAMLGG